MVEKRGELALFSVCFFAAILLAGRAGAVNLGAVDIGKTDVNSLTIQLGQPDDAVYLYYDGVLYAGDCSNLYTPIPGYPLCVHACIQIGSTKTCPVPSRTLIIPNISRGNHTIKAMLINNIANNAFMSAKFTSGATQKINYGYCEMSSGATYAQQNSVGGTCAVNSKLTGNDPIKNFSKTFTFCRIGNEVCNGADDDCDNLVDDGVCICGNSVVESKTGYAEQCDDGNTNDTDSCSNACVPVYPPLYGNCKIDAALSEECDDCNITNGDGCNATGKIESGWSCTLNSTGSSVCKKQICAPASVNSTCIDLETKSTKTCELDEGIGIYNWSEAVETECGDTSFCDFVSGQCIEEGQPPVTFCADYISKDACNEDDAGARTLTVNDYLNSYVLENDGGYEEGTLPSEGFCAGESPLLPASLDSLIVSGDNGDRNYASCNYYVSDCACKWDDNEASCGHSYMQEINCSDIVVATGTCTFATAEVLNECTTKGQITYTRKAKWTGTAEALAGSCSDYVKTYKCAATTKLGFFGWLEFAFASCIIAVIYICRLYLIKKKRELRECK